MAETLTQTEFDKKLQANELALTFVGMSGVGKSRNSKNLAQELGFGRICCDDEIEKELEEVLRELGYSGGIADVSRWLGQPYDDRFAVNQQKYLDLEIATMQDIIRQLEQDSFKGNTVIDTTGSVVHTSAEICAKLSDLTTVVYIEASADMQHKMLELYLAEPKPVVWGNVYNQRGGESPHEALARCYPDLLAYRSRLYASMADVIIPRPVLEMADAKAFLEHVRAALPAAV